ncbi:hypothetical protein OESDEN_11878 [Oesophagostomum dentatum]|uniref:Uncharacterized protein n=1 Tax=Oesophagostomum dentatum TaxID=61180 RepID=A0A0B1SYR1_OESDE|nr:hypothetical protein OESDEN_11878 [Oesophagostomum dentatum]
MNCLQNPENEETDTYYGLNSSRLFPDREKGRINRVSLLEEEKARTGACTPASEGVVLSDTQPTKDKLPSVK